MFGRHRLKLDRNILAKRTSNGEVRFLICCLLYYFSLDKVLDDAWTNPSRTSPHRWMVLCYISEIFNNSIVSGFGVRPHDQKVAVVILTRYTRVNNSVKVIINHFSNIDYSTLLYLCFHVHIQSNLTVVDNA